jgi:signal transduction histidine kinase/ligand-binding sensor domain-containing protein
LLALPLSAPGVSATPPSAEPAKPAAAAPTEPWHLASFLEDADLEGRGIFHLDFEPDGTVWIAASDGLHRYDGYDWKRFTSENGLPSNYVRTVRVTRGGELWVGTDRGAGVFDENGFDTRGSEIHLPGPSVRRITEDPDGTLWFSCDQWPPAPIPSGLARLRDGAWRSWNSASGLPSDYVSNLFTTGAGEQFVLTRNGLARFDGERLRRPLEEAGLTRTRDYFWSMVETADGRLIASTRSHLFVREAGRWQQFANGPPSSSIGELVVTRDGTVLAISSEARARFIEWKQDRFVPIWTTGLDSRGAAQSIAEAPDGSIWVVGVNLLVRWARTGGEWRAFDDLPRPSLRDAEGGIWFAEAEEVLRLAEQRWTRFRGVDGRLICKAADCVWICAPEGLTCWRKGELHAVPIAGSGIVELQTARAGGAGALWITGADARGLPRVASLDGGTWTGFTLPAAKPTETVVLATPDSRRGMWYVAQDRELDRYRLLHANGTTIEEVPIPEPARRYWSPHVRADASGTTWLFGMAGLYRLASNDAPIEWQEVTELPGRQLQNVVARKDEVWFSYTGTTGGRTGVSRLLRGSWEHLAPGARGLEAGDADRLLFYNDDRGVHVVSGASGATPRLLVPPSRDRVAAVAISKAGDFWLGSSRSVYRFRPDGIPPETRVAHGERKVVEGESLTLGVVGVERFVPRSRTRHFDVSTRIDGGPWGEYRPLLDGTITLEDLSVGEHRVEVRVRDQGWDVDPTPAVWRFRVHPTPLQHRAWFQLLAAGVVLTVCLLGVLSIVARQREKRQRVRRRELEHELLQISEREQRRIGRDLHDGVGQRLTGISYQCEALRSMVLRDGDCSAEQAEEIGASVREAISETRALAHALYPPSIDHGSLDIALRSLVDTTGRAFEGSCSFRDRWVPSSLSREKALNVYRLVQEALSNAVRHADASRIEVESRRQGRKWVVEVRDDGCGFEADRASSRGLGLQIMRYRANRIGGWLDVDSQPGVGTRVRCSVPV